MTENERIDIILAIYAGLLTAHEVFRLGGGIAEADAALSLALLDRQLQVEP